MRAFRDAIIGRLDAGDRALFARWTLDSEPESLACGAWRAVSHLGGAWFTILVSLSALLVGGVWRVGGRHALVVLVISHLVVQAIKRTVGRPRPSRGSNFAKLIAEPDRFSFPSGHSAAAVAIAVGASTILPQAAPLFCLLAVLVGLSRVTLGVHFPGDVLAGQLISLVVACAVASLDGW